MGMFIQIEIKDEDFMETVSARTLVDICPVEIFNSMGVQVCVDREQEDECILCDRCIEISGDRLGIVKLYDLRGKDDDNR